MAAMREHLLAVLVGHRLRVLPMTPCRVTRGPGPQELDVACGGRSARLAADGTGLGELARVDADPADGDWQIETGRFRCAFPEGFALVSVDVHAPTPFELAGPDGARIVVESPLEAPEPQQLIGKKRMTGLGGRWVELSFDRDGITWWERHEIRHGMIITAQAPAGSAKPAVHALVRILDTLTIL